MWTPLPKDVGVYVIWQLAEAPVPLSVQLEALKLPSPLVEKLARPVGVEAVPRETSVTVTVHVVCWLTITAVGLQVAVVDVERFTMFRVNVVVLESPLVAVPVTVTVKVPGVAVVLADMLSVEFANPSAGGVTGLVLSVPVTPVGRPVIVRVTGWLNPPTEVTVRVMFPPPPCTMVIEEGLVERLKSAEATVSERLMDLEIVPFAPMTVRVKFPVAAVGLAVSVRMDVAGGRTTLAEKLGVTPSPVVVAPRATGELSPFIERTVIVMLVEEPLTSLG